MWPYSFPYTRKDFKNQIPSPSSSLCGNFINAILKIPLILFETVREMIDQNGNPTATFLSMIYTPGDLKVSAAPLQSPSTQNGVWLLCDGSQYSKTTYPDLYAAIGDTYATQTNPNIGSFDVNGNWTATAAPAVSAGNFRVPDLRGLNAVGVGSLGRSGGNVALGVAAGEELHAMIVSEGAQDYQHHHTAGKFISNAGADSDNWCMLVQGYNSSIQAGDAVPVNGFGGTTDTPHNGTTDNLTGDFCFTGYVDNPVNYNYVTKKATPFAGHNTMQPYLGCYIYVFCGVPVTANTTSPDDTLQPV